MKYRVKWIEGMVFDTMEEAQKKAAEVGGKVVYVLEEEDMPWNNPFLPKEYCPKWIRGKML